ncbi:LPXTG cell wall anchor domain-containing protein [Streptomyces chattanoogensis]|uniref:LPXTG-domain-containing protein cell wall anchor domain protein n=1 Tax=Streptomyces chattanoogensis TaxID=66876 RepID=A0A0N0GW61_9ACTN|nr:LPXTG cell wall anchor domain-containing protein [Streptomyces chattanoogensis]KPC59879.1 LPXTG-domain-containing protein cell wall anchor domain protein [Streptomyces chattanoogensis]
MRPLVSAGTLTAAVAAALLLAPSAYATAPGDNGTVKIHDAKTGEELRKNEPHVCTFYLDAFGFDGDQQVDWHIESWAPTADVKGETVKTGSLTLGGEGHGRTQDLSLPDGHYKLFWNFDGEHGRAKQKVFWTDCAGKDQPGGGNPSAHATPSATAQPTAAQPTASHAGSAPTSPAASPSSSKSAEVNGDLAETGNGAPVGLLSTAAAALVAAGGYLVFRRRKAQQH